MRLSEEIRLSVTKRRGLVEPRLAPPPSAIRAWARAVKALEKERDLFMRIVGLLLDRTEREEGSGPAPEEVAARTIRDGGFFLMRSNTHVYMRMRDDAARSIGQDDGHIYGTDIFGGVIRVGKLERVTPCHARVFIGQILSRFSDRKD